jgi:hypothetical protein
MTQLLLFIQDQPSAERVGGQLKDSIMCKDPRDIRPEHINCLVVESKTDLVVLQFIEQYGEDAVLIWQSFPIHFHDSDVLGRFAAYNETEEERLKALERLRHTQEMALTIQVLSQWNRIE